jgi:CheY-like chemotaxis protein
MTRRERALEAEGVEIAFRRARENLFGSWTGHDGQTLPAQVSHGCCRTGNELSDEPSPEAALEETFLVLEDDEDVRSYSVEILRELGYRVLEAHDGLSALRVLDQHARVDILFTDVVLPGGMTGAQVAAHARALRPKLKVLFTTGYARNAIIHHGRLDKGVQLITKPFSFNDLAAKIRDVLDN